jgi:hypothetical protein
VVDKGSLVYTPTEATQAGIEYIKSISENKHRAMPVYISGMRDYFAPVMPGRIAAIIAQTSHYKSGFLRFQARETALEIASKEERQDECLFWVSTEEDVEEQMLHEFAHYSREPIHNLAHGTVLDWDRLLGHATEIGTVPIYRIAVSLAGTRDVNSTDLYMSNVARELVWAVEEFNLKPAGLFVDYLQALPLDPEIRKSTPDARRRLQVREDVYRLRDAARELSCPVWVAIQAKQHLDHQISREFKMPGLYDGEETAAIAQRFDRVITAWLPKMDYPIGSPFKLGSREFETEENLLFLRVAKQRGGYPSGRIWACRIDYDTNTIEPEQLVEDKPVPKLDLEKSGWYEKEE